MPIVGQFGSLAGFGVFPGGALESIATVTATGSAASVEFTNIPSTFQHLQIRGIVRTAQANVSGAIRARVNGDTASNYRTHYLRGTGAAAQAGSTTGTYLDDWLFIAGANSTSSSVGAVIIDILDYANTSKNTTLRALSGHDSNGDGMVSVTSGLWLSTSAVTSVLLEGNGTNLNSVSTFALYGVRA
jgi:hypothetical protein